jgi:hypothetical protein
MHKQTVTLIGLKVRLGWIHVVLMRGIGHVPLPTLSAG